MSGISRDQLFLFRQVKIGKIKSGANGTAYQGIIAARGQARSKPVARRYYTLKGFIVIGVAAKPVFYQLALLIYFINDKGISKIEMPYLIAFYFMKSRELVLLQQEVDAGAKGAVTGKAAGQGQQWRQRRRPVYFPESAPLDMGNQL